MLIGLISDIHNHKEPLRAALQLLAAEGCTTILCLGDIASVNTLRFLRANAVGELHLVAGNNDHPRAAFANAAAALPDTTYHGDTAELVVDGRHIFMTHKPETALIAARYGDFDAIFYGHTHRPMQTLEGHMLIANPGEVQGRYNSRSVAVYDTADNTLRHLNL